MAGYRTGKGNAPERVDFSAALDAMAISNCPQAALADIRSRRGARTHLAEIYNGGVQMPHGNVQIEPSASRDRPPSPSTLTIATDNSTSTSLLNPTKASPPRVPQQVLRTNERAFESLSFLLGLRQRFAGRKVANERDLEYFQHSIVEDPVSSIVNILRGNAATKRQFNLASGVVFDNHPNVLSDGAEEPMGRRAAHDPNQLRADQICVYRHDEADPTQRSLAFVVEYKPPHKLTLPYLRLGLREMMFKRRVVAAAVAHTYNYMLTAGLEYSYLTTGEAFVFFRIDWAHPGHLLFHLAEPQLEVDAHPDNSTHYTAVSQVLAFTLLAFTSSPRGQDARHQAMEQLEQWQEDYEAILRRIPVPNGSRRRHPRPSNQERTGTSIGHRTTFVVALQRLHAVRYPKTPPATNPRNILEKYHSSGQSAQHPEGSSEPAVHISAHNAVHTIETKGRAASTRKYRLPFRNGVDETEEKARSRQAQSTPSDRRHGAPGSPQLRQYCLLGLVKRGPLDHGSRPVLDKDVVKLRKQGARGVAFQVTLAAYGYTFIAKGTVPEFVEDLVQEGTVYERLKASARSWRTRFSRGHQSEMPPAGPGRTSWVIHRLGVTHGDVRTANILWCSETNRPMLIDFERAALAASPPLKKKVKSPKRLKSELRGHRQFQSADNTRQLQQIVLNGGVCRPSAKLSGQARSLLHSRSRSLGNAAAINHEGQEGEFAEAKARR
ncbi:hypothetical protein B0T11DRAFT_294569 [Plectosphaerella cucumerina]|uniref:Uncharacterized protein n=1 Tax=Plectosphaerella cucumerina TaxID=40658 RepID=A0A8K0TS39_9PEZI|nr:hypothetical protein B0T11DRAFT_294569 [Plectosphaerella cucumerina]